MRQPISIGLLVVSALLAALGCSDDGGSTSSCTSNLDCANGLYCNAAGSCTQDCKSKDDCSSGEKCNSYGKCIADSKKDGGVPKDGALPTQDKKIAPDVKPAPDLKVPPDTKPLPDTKPAPDSKPWPDVNPGLDSKPWPDAKTWPDTAPPPDLAPPPDAKPPLNNDNCSTPKPLTMVGGLASVTGTTATAINKISLSASGCTGYSTPGPDRFFSINLAGGKLYKVSLTSTSSFDPALYVFKDCNKPASTCQPGMGSDRLGNGVLESVLLAPQVSSAYIIGVDSYSSTVHGAFTLTVQEFTPPLSNNACANAQALTFNLGVASESGNTNGATNSSLGAQCIGSNKTHGPDLFYSVYLTKGKKYKIQLLPEKKFDPKLYVFTDCANINGTCEHGMGSSTFGGGIAEEVTLSPAISGKYYIAVDSSSATAKGSFLVLVSEINSIPNDTCSSATHLKLTSGDWRFVPGDTRTGANAVTLSSGGCTGASTPGNDLFYSFDIVSGRDYELRLFPSSSFDPALYVISDCSKPEATCSSYMGSDKIGSGVVEKVTFKALTNTKMYAAIDSWDTGESGQFALWIKETGAPPCNTSTCSGCCFNNACVSGIAKYACGSGGAKCQSCGQGMTCSTGGKCELDPAGKWQVAAYSASIQATNNGSPWDTFAATAKPDPYVEITTGGTTKSSSYKSDTLMPFWNENVIQATAGQLKSSFVLRIWDDDWGFDDLIGKCTPAITDSILLGSALTITCGKASVVLYFYSL